MFLAICILSLPKFYLFLQFSNLSRKSFRRRISFSHRFSIPYLLLEIPLLTFKVSDGCTHILGLLLKIVDIHLLSTCKFSFLPSCLYSLCFVVISQSSCYLELSSLLIYIPTIFWRCCSIISARSCLLRPKSVSIIFLPLVTSDCNKPK